VNGQSTEGRTHDEVVDMMKHSEDKIILMQVKHFIIFQLFPNLYFFSYEEVMICE